MTRNDEDIKKDIIDQIYWDSRVSAADVKVAVSAGKATLSGTVPSFFSRTAASEDTLSIRGVTSLDNQLVVKHAGVLKMPTNEEIKSNIDNVLRWSSEIDESNITVTVNDGVVTIEGSVDTHWKKNKLEKLIEDMIGVSRVINQVAIVPLDNVVDELIAEEIVKALNRNSSITVDTVGVEVANGNVILSGSVPSWTAYQAAQEVAEYTKGVNDIKNNLVIT
jgi:osmotically-inducible protein OsmY